MVISYYWSESSASHKLHLIVRFALRNLWLIVNLIWSLPAAAAIVLCKTIKFIRIGVVSNNRIGHFVQESVEYFRQSKDQSFRFFDYYYFVIPNSCNQFWESLVKRNLNIKPRFFRHIAFGLRFVPGGHAHLISNGQFGRISILDRPGNEVFNFFPDEDRDGVEWLKGMGWKENEPFICLMVRDADYLANDSNQGRGKPHLQQSWSYHSYRDSNISDYEIGIKWLLDQGNWVIRMGKSASTRLSITHPHLVDYAFLETRSDFLDVWLFANATATITTGTGPDMIASCYNKPLLYLNYLPLINILSWTNSITTPKQLEYENSSTRLNLTQHLENGFLSTREYQKHGIRVVDLTPDEILIAIKEFWFGLLMDDAEFKFDVQLQNLFWTEISKTPNYLDLHPVINPACRISDYWLRQNIAK